MFHACALPRFTTERYWVLSEIEQNISRFVCIDSLIATEDAVGDAVGDAIVSSYLLWNAEKECIDELKQRIDKFLVEITTRGYIKDDTLLYIAIEVLLVESKWPMHQKDMDSLMQYLLSKSVVGHVVCGVSDDVASSCGLEALLKYYTTIFSSNPILNGNINCFIIAESMDHFLGHDVTRDPDAKDNVVQFLYSSLSDEEYIPWINGHIVAKLKDVQIKKPPPSPEYISNYWFYMGMLLMFIGCFVVPFVLKMSIYYYFTNLF